MKVLDYGAERKWQGLSALSVPLLPKPPSLRALLFQGAEWIASGVYGQWHVR